MELRDALSAAKRGDAIAIVGAGLSVGAVNKNKADFAVGSQLAERLLQAIQSSESADYSLASELYKQEHEDDPTALATFLNNEFTAESVNDEHIAFASIPWKRIYTTNFDNVIEKAGRSAGRDYLSVVTRKPPKEYDRSRPWAVHLHGFVGDLASADATAPFVLTRSSYLDLELPKTAWPTLLQRDIAAARAIFVIGQSLGDLHIARLLREDSAAARKTFIVTRANPGKAFTSAASKLGHVVDIGLSGFLSGYKAAEDNTPSDQQWYILNFRKYALPEAASPPSQDDVYKLLTGGRFNDAAYLHSVIDGSRPYSVFRSVALNDLKEWSGAPRKFLAYSKIGNGKTVFLSQVSVDLVRSGYSVFHCTGSGSDFYKDIEEIKNLSTPIAFLFDGLREFEGPIKAAADALEARDVLIVATRPTAFASDFSNLRNVLGDGFRRIDLDTISRGEATETERLLDFYGLWGVSAGPNKGARLNFIREECDSEIRSVVLHAFKESTLGERIGKPIEALSEHSPRAHQTLSALFICRLSDAPLDFWDVCQIMDMTASEFSAAISKKNVDQLLGGIESDSGIRSSILSEHALARVIPAEICLDVLDHLITRLVQFRSADWRYEESISRILRFAIITKIFAGKSRRPFLIRLYEKVLEIGYLREDPQFWLQLAMARMEENEFEPAKLCLDTAYQRAKSRPKYRTYMLDNQQIRWLTGSCVSGQNHNIDHAAIETSRLLTERLSGMGGELDDYLIRVTHPIGHFWDKFATKLSDSARVALQDAMVEMLEAIDDHRAKWQLSDDERRIRDILQRRVRA
ncbi:MAG: SIR2 family protein [Caulobacteraceae bacterium]|nr:SIR2 family protein [Caulobacteraceae bacterium]